MDRHPFDALTRVLFTAPSRRALLSLLGCALAAPLFTSAPLDARKKKNKKKPFCLDGQTIKASKKKKKKLLKRGATPGACSPPLCTPSCAANACGGDDGCGGTCGCAAGSLCYGGVCTPCTVACTGNATACGNELATALNGGGTVYACPGRYAGNFAFTAVNVSLIGAGDGEEPASNTILDANGSGRVLIASSGVTALLHGLRITGGNLTMPGESGAGISNSGPMTLTACTVAKNSSGGVGGGIVQGGGILTLNDCIVSGNTSLVEGGGIFALAGSITINGSAITGNKGSFGGGLYNQVTVTFDSASSVTGNMATSAGGGGGIFNEGGTVALNDANVSGNSPNDCANVDGCAG